MKSIFQCHPSNRVNEQKNMSLIGRVIKIEIFSKIYTYIHKRNRETSGTQ